MTLRVLLAALHLLALGIGLGAVWVRSRAFKSDSIDRASLSRIFQADAWWGIAALVWFSTGVIRALGTYEKGTEYYMRNPLFHTKLTLFLGVVVLEIAPMLSLIRWRRAVAKGEMPDTSKARRFATISVAQAHILIVMVFLAVALARGVGAR